MILLTDGATLVEYWDGVRLIPPVESEDGGSWSVKPEEIAAEQGEESVFNYNRRDGTSTRCRQGMRTARGMAETL